MSGAEFAAVLGFAASLVQVLDTSKKVIDRVKKYKKSIVFEDTLPRLQLFLLDIEKLKSHTTTEHIDEDEKTALVRVLDGCHRQLAGLDSTIQEVSPAEGSSKLQRTWMGLRSFGKDSKIREFLANLDQYRATLNFHLSSRTSIMTHERFKKPEEAKSLQCYFKIPARQVSNFVGRSALLEELKEAILSADLSISSHQASHQSKKPITLVLTGLGGQGKSQAAMRLCQELAPNFRGVFWINSSSKASTSSDFERYASLLAGQSLPFSKHEENVEYFKSALTDWEHPWLLVFDNYDNPRTFPDISSFFHLSRGPTMSTIVITSRNSESGRLGRAFRLEGLSAEEGFSLLLARVQPAMINDKDFAAAKRIVEKLGHLPLAIDQASNYIASRQMPLEIFEKEYEKRKSVILAHTPASLWEYQTSHSPGNPQASEVNLSAFTTWEFSMDQITNNRSCIEEMLTQVAFLDASSISETLLISLFKVNTTGKDTKLEWMSTFCDEQQWSSSRFQDIIVELLSMSLIQGMQYENSELSFSLHPVVRDWLQLRISDDQRQQKTYVAMSTLANHIAMLETEDIQFEARRELLKQVDACQRNAQYFLTTIESKQKFGGYIEGHQTVIASFYADNDRKEDAVKLYFEVLNLQESRLGIADLATLSTMNNFGILQLSLGEYESAFKILDRVLNEKERILPLEHERVLNTVNNLGNVCVALRYFDRAKELFQRLREVYESEQNTTQRRFVALYNNLGEIELRQGMIESAEVYFDKAITYSPRSADGKLRGNEVACHVLENQAKVYESQGKLGKALNTQIEAENAFGKLLGIKHPRSVAAADAKARLWRLFEFEGTSTDETNTKRRRVSYRSNTLDDEPFGDWDDVTVMKSSTGGDRPLSTTGISEHNMSSNLNFEDLMPIQLEETVETQEEQNSPRGIESHGILQSVQHPRPTQVSENLQQAAQYGIQQEQQMPRPHHGIQQVQTAPALASSYGIHEQQVAPEIGSRYGIQQVQQAWPALGGIYGIQQVQSQGLLALGKRYGIQQMQGIPFDSLDSDQNK